MMNKKEKKISLYVHIPFCVRKCYYCDFLSFPLMEKQDIKDKYISHLLKEIRCWSKVFEDRNLELNTVFIGGGTPSLLNDDIQKICDEIVNDFSCETEIEFSMEVNPKLPPYLLNTPINRVSIGCQSTNNTELEALGRIHKYGDFLETYYWVREQGILNVNVDLMSDIPGQTLSSYEKSLNDILLLKPEHISAYSLIIEPGTKFYELYEKDELDIPDEETDRKMYHMTKEILGSHGYERYEISNYSIPGYECEHNLVYWELKDYVGVGLGASSYFDDYRFKNFENFSEYFKSVEKFLEYVNSGKYGENSFLSDIFSEVHIQSEKEKMEEFFFLGLRKTSGVNLKEFEQIFNKNPNLIYGEVFRKLEDEKLLEFSDDRKNIFLNDKGMDLSNYCMEKFLL